MNKKAGIIALLGIVFSMTTGCNEASVPEKKEAKTDKTTAITDNTKGTTVMLRGTEIHTVGTLPEVGSELKAFTLTDIELNEKTKDDFKGKYIVMNIFPSVNTGVCATSVRTFNKTAADLKNTIVLCISKDLPFAQKAFCGAEGIENVVMLSDFRNDFGKDFGVLLADGPMKGLLSRAVIVIDPQGKIVYKEQVADVGNEPNYETALAAIK